MYDHTCTNVCVRNIAEWLSFEKLGCCVDKKAKNYSKRHFSCILNTELYCWSSTSRTRGYIGNTPPVEVQVLSAIAEICVRVPSSTTGVLEIVASLKQSKLPS